MEDAFVSFVSSCLLEPDRDLCNGKISTEEDVVGTHHDESIVEFLPYSHDVHLIPLRDRAFSWDVNLENDKVHPDLLLGSLAGGDKMMYRPKFFANTRDRTSSLGDIFVKEEHGHDEHSHDAAHLMMDENEELFGDELVPQGGYMQQHLQHQQQQLGGGGAVQPYGDTLPPGPGTRPRPRIRVTLKAESPAPSVSSSSNGNGRKVNVKPEPGTDDRPYHYSDTVFQQPLVSNAPSSSKMSDLNMMSMSSLGMPSSLGMSMGMAGGMVASSSILTLPSGMTTLSSALGGGDRRVGAYTLEERRIKIEKFRERKRQRIWRKQIKYDCRKRLADTRPRVKGRFVSRKKMGGDGGEDGAGDGSGDEEDDGNNLHHMLHDDDDHTPLIPLVGKETSDGHLHYKDANAAHRPLGYHQSTLGHNINNHSYMMSSSMMGRAPSSISASISPNMVNPYNLTSGMVPSMTSTSMAPGITTMPVPMVSSSGSSSSNINNMSGINSIAIMNSGYAMPNYINPIPSSVANAYNYGVHGVSATDPVSSGGNGGGVGSLPAASSSDT